MKFKLFVLCLLMISFVSAANWDNKLDYENSDLRVRFSNSILGIIKTDEIGIAQLTSHRFVNEIREVPIGEEVVTMFYDFNWKENHKDGLGEVEFIDKKTGQTINKEFYFVVWEEVTETKDNYERECSTIYNPTNKSWDNICDYVLVSTSEVERFVWKKLEGTSIPKGISRIGISTEVNHGDHVDAIWTIAGKKVKKHAQWTATLNVNLEAYYKMDEQDVSGSGTIIDSTDKYNISNVGTSNSSGFINTAYDYDGATDYINVTNSMDFSSGDFSISMWINSDTGAGGGEEWFFHYRDANLVTRMSINDGGRDIVCSIGDASLIAVDAELSGWQHIIITGSIPGTTYLYLNGTLFANATSTIGGGGSFFGFLGTESGFSKWFDGKIDEVSIWNRTVSAAEAEQLYNNGSGISWIDVVFNPTVTLDSPANGSLLSGVVSFVSTITPNTGFNVTNATFFLWDENDTLFAKDTNIITGNESNTTTFQIINLSTGNYKWNVLGYVTDGVTTDSNFSEFNSTFDWQQFNVTGELYNSSALETSTQTFFLNLSTLPSVISLDASLNYDGVLYPGAGSCTVGSCEINSTIDLPLVSSGELENKSFFWEVTVFDGTSSVKVNTTANLQNVSRLHLEICNASYTTQTLNFTSFDEQTMLGINPFLFEADFQFWTGTGTVTRNQSFINNSVSPSIRFCLKPIDTNLKIGGIVEYDEAADENYTKRNYFFDNDTINNQSQDIGLGLLKSSESTTFILLVQDRDILPFPGALIFTQRFYSGTDQWKTVQVSRTAENGKTVGFFETEVPNYRFIIKVDGSQVLLTEGGKIVPEETPFTLIFTIGEGDIASWSSFEDLANLNKDLSWDPSTQIVSFSYSDSSGGFSLGRLIVERLFSNSTGYVEVCDKTSSESSAIISCNITGNSTGTYTARALITRGSTTTLVEQLNFQIETFSQTAGRLGLFLGWFLILFSAFVFKFNEVAGIISINAMIIFVNIIGLVAFSWTFVSGIIAVSLIILILLER